MSDVCDLCRAHALEPVYWPERPAKDVGRDTVVHLCPACGLVQSLPRSCDTAAALAAIAASARHPYRRSNRTSACMKLLRAHTDIAAPLAVLDIGFNRGPFASAIAAAMPQAKITGCAPFEEIDLAPGCFDIAHCSGIERVPSPAALLQRIWNGLRPGGLLIVDAPNLIAIGADDIVDEWFDDSTRYCFSPVTLGRVLDAAGFTIIDGPNPLDRENLTFAALKRSVVNRPVPKDGGEAERARALIGTYSAARARNMVALAAMSAELARLAPRRVAMWGAGRLFDTLVTHGGFDPKSVEMVVDGLLTARKTEKHGIRLVAPDALAHARPGIIVVMSRTFAREIARIARRHAPKAEIILYSDLLARARMALAA
jgi:hypothetical protein